MSQECQGSTFDDCLEELQQIMRVKMSKYWDKMGEEENPLHWSTIFKQRIIGVCDETIAEITSSDLFDLLEKRNQLLEKKQKIDKKSTTPEAYKNRGGRLLKDEKERKAVSKELSKIEEQLLDRAKEYENKAGKPFSSNGRTIEAIIHENKKLTLSAGKKRAKSVTPEKSQNLTVKSVKRKIAIPSVPSKHTKVLGSHNDNVPQTAPPKLLVNGHLTGRSRYSIERAKCIEKCRRVSQRMQQKRMDKENSSIPEVSGGT